MIRKITRVFLVGGAFSVIFPSLFILKNAIRSVPKELPHHFVAVWLLQVVVGCAAIFGALGVRRRKRWGSVLLEPVCWLAAATIVVGLVLSLWAQLVSPATASVALLRSHPEAWLVAALVAAFALWVCVWLVSVARVIRKLARRAQPGA